MGLVLCAAESVNRMIGITPCNTPKATLAESPSPNASSRIGYRVSFGTAYTETIIGSSVSPDRRSNPSQKPTARPMTTESA